MTEIIEIVGGPLDGTEMIQDGDRITFNDPRRWRTNWRVLPGEFRGHVQLSEGDQITVYYLGQPIVYRLEQGRGRLEFRLEEQ